MQEIEKSVLDTHDYSNNWCNRHTHIHTHTHTHTHTKKEGAGEGNKRKAIVEICFKPKQENCLSTYKPITYIFKITTSTGKSY